MNSAFPLSHISTQFEHFFSTALHLILCVKEVYPQETFARKRKFGCLSWWSESPQLCQYVSQVGAAIRELILKKLLAKVVIVLLTRNAADNTTAAESADSDESSSLLVPGEKFIFELTNFEAFWSAPSVFGPVTTEIDNDARPVNPGSQWTFTGIAQKKDNQARESVVADAHIEECFRDVLVKLQYSDILGPKDWRRTYNCLIDAETITRLKATWLPSQNVLRGLRGTSSADNIALIEDIVQPMRDSDDHGDIVEQHNAMQVRQLKAVKVRLKSTGRVANIIQVAMEGEAIYSSNRQQQNVFDDQYIVADDNGYDSTVEQLPGRSGPSFSTSTSTKAEMSIKTDCKTEEDLFAGLDELL